MESISSLFELLLPHVNAGVTPIIHIKDLNNEFPVSIESKEISFYDLNKDVIISLSYSLHSAHSSTIEAT